MPTTPKSPVAIVGPFFESEVSTTELNVSLFDSIIEHCEARYGNNSYYIVSLGCDRGFGKDVRVYCQNTKHHMVQIESHIITISDAQGYKLRLGSAEDYAKIFAARYAALMELCQIFFVRTTSKRTVLDNLIHKLRNSDKPYYLYNEDNILVEYKGDPFANGPR